MKINTVAVNFVWDFDFQGRVETDVPKNRRPYLTIAAGLLHGNFGESMETYYYCADYEEIKIKSRYAEIKFLNNP